MTFTVRWFAGVVLLIGLNNEEGRSQSLSLTITNKSGSPRVSLPIVYDIHGINVENPSVEPSLLPGLPASSRAVLTDQNGRASIPLPAAELVRQASVLQGSKQIRVTLYPNGSEPLLPARLELLLGDASHDMTIVMKDARKKTVEADVLADSGAYRGSWGTVLYEEGVGMAVLLNAADGNRVFPLQRYSTDQDFIYFRQSDGSSRLWALALLPTATVCEVGFNHGGCCEQKYVIWSREGAGPRSKWKRRFYADVTRDSPNSWR